MNGHEKAFPKYIPGYSSDFLPPTEEPSLPNEQSAVQVEPQLRPLDRAGEEDFTRRVACASTFDELQQLIRNTYSSGRCITDSRDRSYPDADKLNTKINDTHRLGVEAVINILKRGDEVTGNVLNVFSMTVTSRFGLRARVSELIIQEARDRFFNEQATELKTLQHELTKSRTTLEGDMDEMFREVSEGSEVSLAQYWKLTKDLNDKVGTINSRLKELKPKGIVIRILEFDPMYSPVLTLAVTLGNASNPQENTQQSRFCVTFNQETYQLDVKLPQ